MANITKAIESMRSLPITRYTHKTGKMIFIPLPAELWRPMTDGISCGCDICKSDKTSGYWDTLAISADAPKGNRNDFTYTVHYPALHPLHVRKAKAYSPVTPPAVPQDEPQALTDQEWSDAMFTAWRANDQREIQNLLDMLPPAVRISNPYQPSGDGPECCNPASATSEANRERDARNHHANSL